MGSLDSSSVQQALQGGSRYLDVRTVDEFLLGHVPEAFNLPLQHGTLAGLVDNPEFVSVAVAQLDPNAEWIVGCRSGRRAQQAIERLAEAGFSRLRLHIDSWEGSKDAFGRSHGGWRPSGLPVEVGDPFNRCLALPDSLERPPQS